MQGDERAEVRGPRDFSETWASYVLAEQRALVARAEGILAHALARRCSESPGRSSTAGPRRTEAWTKRGWFR